jgi:hypothetical protein
MPEKETPSQDKYDLFDPEDLLNSKARALTPSEIEKKIEESKWALHQGLSSHGRTKDMWDSL